jgi:hypothetical protein
MILVDVSVPSIDRTYNFSLDENVPVSQVVEELMEMVERKEQTAFVGNRSAVVLIHKDSKRVLHRDQTLFEAAVSSGSTLMLL